MVEQRSLDFEDNSQDRELTAEQALEAALRISRGTNPDSRAAAATAWEEAEQLAIGCADPKMQMRVYETSGDFQCARGGFGIAEKKYKTALGSAQLLAVTSDDGFADEERLRFKLARVRNAHDPSFAVFEKVVQRSHSYEQGNIAWARFQEDRANSVGRLAARNVGSEEDFRKRLKAAIWTPTDDEDEEVR